MHKEFENKDLLAAKEIFDKYITITSDNFLYLKDNEIKDLDRIKNKLLHNFIYAFYLQCVSFNIDFELETGFDNINKLSISNVELIKILNIFSDNSIEACKKNGGKIVISIKMLDLDYLVIIIKNTFTGTFEFKGNGRGNGLKIAEKIIDSLDNVNLNTTVENGYYIQKLVIMQSEL